MSISLVGSGWDASGTALKTLSVSPTHSGDVLVLSVMCASATVQISAVSGGGCPSSGSGTPGAWTQLAFANPGSAEGDEELWFGTVTATGTSTITITTTASSTIALFCEQLTSSGVAVVWAADGAGAASASTSTATSGNFPSVTATSTGELWLGCGRFPGSSFTITTSGYTSVQNPANSNHYFAYKTSASGTIDPAWTMGSSTWGACAGLLTATPRSFFPTISVEVAFTNPVYTASPTWTDITKYVQSFTTSLGRQHELQQVNPSTAVIQLMNEPNGAGDPGGRFSPWNTNSPYYHSGTGLTPGHPVRITATIASTTYNVFYGYTQSWVPAYGQTSSSMTLNCYDTLALLNLSYLDAQEYQAQVITDGATAYWECQDLPGSVIFADATGNGNTGVVNGAVATFGNPGALMIQGDTCVTFAGNALMNTGITASDVSGDYSTWEGWFKTAETDQVLMSWPHSSSGVGTWLLTNSSGEAALQYGTFGGTMTNLVTGPVIDNGLWHHIVVVVPTTASTTFALYVDGVFIAEGTTPSGYNWAFTTQGALVGGFLFDNTGLGGGILYEITRYTGSVDQVAWYNSVLTFAQVAEHYQLGSAGFIVQDSGSRVTAILEDAGVPTGLLNIDSGTVQVAGATSTLTETTTMSYLQTVINTERGFLYQDTTGTVQYKNRWHVYTSSRSLTAQATFSYHSGNQYYLSVGLVPQADDEDLWNDIPVAIQGGVPQIATNSTSVTNYGRRTLQGYTSLLFIDNNDAYDLASGLLYQYQNPAPRVRSISTDSTVNNGAVMPYALAIQPLDLIDIVWKPIDGSSVDFSQASLVEQITHNVVPGKWTTSFAVTPIGTEVFGLWNSGLWGSAIWGF